MRSVSSGGSGGSSAHPARRANVDGTGLCPALRLFVQKLLALRGEMISRRASQSRKKARLRQACGTAPRYTRRLAAQQPTP